MRIIVFVCVLIFCGGVFAESSTRPIPKEEWTDSAKLWLARSCVGEAGFSAYEECLGIAWVYAVRWRLSNGRVSFETVIRSYSSAVKRSGMARRKWIAGLNLEGARPSHWPKNLSWLGHKKFWNTILFELDQWAKGFRENPVAGADHYGGHMDAPHRTWVRVKPRSKVRFKNIFYRSLVSSNI